MITILFEDQAEGGNLKNFGPACLLAACVADRLGRDFWAVKRVINGIALKGNSKVLARCKEGSSYRQLVLLDADRFTEMLGLPKGSVCAALKAGWTSQCPLWPTGDVVLLDQNTESLVREVAGLLGRPMPPKSIGLRDDYLNSLAFDRSDRGLEQRRQLLSAMPSFARLVERVSTLVGEVDPR